MSTKDDILAKYGVSATKVSASKDDILKKYGIGTHPVSEQTRAAMPLPSVGVSEKEPTLLERVGKTLTAAGKGTLGDSVNILGTLQDIDTRYRAEKERMGDTSGTVSLGKEGYSVKLGGSKESDTKAKEIQTAADKLKESSAADAERAKQGLGGVGRFAVDLGVAGAQMAGDIALGALGGTGALAPMAARVFGGSAQEARQSGATLGQQLAYGAGSAALSVATEQIANTSKLMRKAFGKSTLASAVAKKFGDKGVTKAITEAVEKMQQTAAGRAAINAISEGGEEFIEDIFQPRLQRATYDKDAKFDLAGAIYDAAVGGALGVIGGIGERKALPGGTEVQENTAQSEFERIRLKTAEEEAAMQKTASAGETEIKSKFKTDLDSWMKTTTPEQRAKDGGRFLIGHTSEQLKQADVDDYDIYFGKSKIAKILLNLEMTPQIIKEVADVVERPIIVMDSKTVPGSITMFGESKTGNGKPVMVSMLLHPANKTGEILDYGVVTSAYGRRTSNAQNLIDTSNIRYIDPDEKRTGDWMKALGLQLPSASSVTSSENSMPQNNGNVKSYNAVMPLPGEEINTEANRRSEQSEFERIRLKAAEEEAAERELNAPTSRKRNGPWKEIRSPLYEIDESLESGLEMPEEYGGKKEYLQDALEELNREREARRMSAAERKPSIAKRDFKREVMSYFSIPAGQKAEIENILERFADRVTEKEQITQQDYEALFDKLYKSGVMEVPAEESLQEARAAIRNGHIYVNDSIKADFGDDWQNFRKRAWGAGVYLTNDDSFRGPDVWNAQLAEDFPHLFDAESMDGRDMLERIVQAAEDGKAQKLSLSEYAELMAKEEHISEDVMLDNLAKQLESAVRTFAEKAKLETYLRNRTDEMVRKDREKRRKMRQEQTERKALSELQNKTLKQLKWLSKNRNKAPKDMRKQFDEVLGNIDILAINTANEMHVDNATGKTWKDLRDLYLKAKDTDPNFLPSKELDKIVMRLDGDKIGEMDVSALNDLYKAAVGLRTEFYNRNNVINDELGRTFSEAYHASIDEVKATDGTTKKKKADQFFNEQQLTPMNFLRRMTGWKDGTFTSFAKGLEKGERDYKGYVVDAKKKLGDFIEKNKDWVKTADGQGKDAVWYEIKVPELLELGMGDKPIFGDTVTVYMTPAQKAYMALEAQNYDNLRHMTGGRTFANKELYAHGDRAAAFANGTTVKLAPETVKKIVSDLTPTEKELYKVLHEYFNVYAKERINGVSNPLYGYDRALTSEYAPIYTNQNYVGHEAGMMDATVEGVGALKSRQYSKNPTYNVSAFDAFDRHVDAAARFVGYAIPIRNMQTLMNWRGKNTSMRDEISHKWLDSGTKYIDDLMTDLQQTKINDKGFIDNEVGKLLSNYVSGVFGANPGIVFKQFMSYPQFASQMGWDTMPNPKKFAKVDTALIDKYTPELAYRLLGYATPEAAAMRQNKNGVTETKVGGFILGGGAITAMDGFTVARAWPWAENYVSKHFPNLEKGTQAEIEAGKSPYYQKVAEVFNDAVNTTQPMYDTMHRAKIMQSGGGIQRAFTMFKTVPLQQYNTLRRAFGELQEAKTGGTQEQKKAAAKTAANAVTATLASAAGLELVELLNQLWKNGAKGYKDDDDELTAESVTKQVGLRMFGDLAGITVGGSELAELLENIFLGEKWYGIEIPGGEQLNDVIDTLSGTINSISKIITDGIDLADKGGDLGAYLKKNAPDYAGDIKDLAEKTALYVGGLPAENIEKYLKGTIRAAAPEVYTYLEDRFDTADKTGLKGLTGKQLQIRTADILKNRGVNTESSETMAGLYESGHKEAVPSDTPKTVSVKNEDRALSASETQKFDNAWRKAVNGAINQLVGLKGFINAGKEGQAKMLDRLYDYAAEKGKAAVFKDFEPSKFAEDAEKSPLPLAEHIEFSYRVSQIEADKDKNGNSISGSKKEKVLAAIDAMDIPDEQKDALYLLQGYAETTINEAPWNGGKAIGLPKLPELKKLELPKIELPALELPR